MRFRLNTKEKACKKKCVLFLGIFLLSVEMFAQPKGDDLSAMSFVLAANVVTGNAPYGVAVSDLDADGKPDIVTANNLSATFSVLKNTSVSGLVSFADKVDFSAGSGPYSIAVGDVDSDGKPDVVVANYNDDNVSVFKNTSSGGTISFAPGMVYSTGNTPVHVAIQDLDSDGMVDIATANYLDNSVSLLRNTSAGGMISFAPKADFSVSLAPAHLAIGDLNQDGKPDIAVACELSNGIRVMENQSTAGTFNFSVGFTMSTWHKPKSVAIGDLDGDGKPDLAVANTASEFSVDGYCISILRNTHTGSDISFSTAVNVKTVAYPQDIAIHDIDGDSKPDVAVSLFAGYVSILKNNCAPANISFLTGVSYPETDPFHLVLCDMDGDAKPEVVAPSLVSYRVAVLRNRINEPVVTSFSPTRAGAGETVTLTGINFAGATAVSFGGVSAHSFTISNPTTVVAQVGSGASGAVLVTTPQGTGLLDGFVLAEPPAITSFSPSSGVAGTVVIIKGKEFTGATAVAFGGISATSFTVKDDATIEAVAGDGASGEVRVTTPYGQSTLAGFTHMAPQITGFTPASAGPGDVVTISGSNFTGITAVSFGGIPAYSFTVNNSTTITAVVAGGADGQILVQTSDASAAMSGFEFISPPAPVITSFAPASGTLGTIVTLTGDHFNPATTGNVVYFGATQATVTEANEHQVKVRVPAGASYQPISILNTDTHLAGYSRVPFIVTFAGGGYITSNTFSGKSDLEFEAYNYPMASEIADVDGDGKPDIISSVAPHWRGFIYKNTSIGGTTSFTLAAEVSGLSGDFTVRDVDGDAKPDIVVASNGPDVRILRNTSTPGNFSFAPAITLKTLGDSHTIGIGDLDGDGKPDLVVPNYGTLSVTVFKNTCVPGRISFVKVTDYTTGGTANDVSITDLDGDGKPDVAVTNASGSLSVFRNTSTTDAISLSARVDYATAEGCNHLRISDLNGDMNPDIVVSYLYSSSFSVFKNTSVAGTISLEPSSDQLAGGASSDLELADIDGDGMIDIAMADDPGGKTAMVFRNTSSGGVISFAPGVGSASGPAWAIALNDLNGDAKPDLVAATPDWYRITILTNQTGSPDITSFSPPTAFEGDEVTISGFGFDGVTAVTFGDVPAASFTVNSSNSITAVVGTGASGWLKVTSPAGTSVSEDGFTHLVPPVITGFTPATAPTGVAVIITGANFFGTTAVNFGGTTAQSFTINSTTRITAVVGAGASGDVSITTQGGTAALDGFTFVTPPPVISSFEPGFGVPGTVITISGSGFTGATAVSIGGVPARSFTVNSATEITAIVDTASGDIAVTTPYGTGVMGAFTILPEPTITSFAPTSASAGMPVTIRGTHLAGYRSITFGGVHVQSIVSTSDEMLVVNVGPGASGDVVVTTQGGGRATMAGFTFTRPPAITSFNPTAGTTGDLITITGTDFNDVTEVTFGGVEASSFTILEPTKITAVVSAGASGQVSVTTTTGTASAKGFTYTLVTATEESSNVGMLALKLCPNPVDRTAVVSYPTVQSSSSLIWMDIVGNTIKEIVLPGNTSQVEVDVKDLSSGIYKITWSDGVTRLTQTAMVR